jgi:hypothetical protein
VIIGIDPGKSGGICSITDDNEIKANKCPENVKGMVDLLRKCTSHGYVETEKVSCIIEFVWAFPLDGVSNAFKFGKNFGMWIGILSSLGIPYIKVIPQKWQKDYHPLSKIKKERKNKLKMIAKNFYPKATLSTSDAILIALWGKNHGDI